MRILHFCEKFSTRPETFIYDYVTELQNKGFENHVLTFERKNEEERPFDNVHIVQKPGKWNIERVLRRIWDYTEETPITASWPQIRRKLKQKVQEIAPDVIHAQFGPNGVLISPIADELDIPLVVTFHGYDVSRLIQHEGWVKQYEKHFPDFSAFVGVSNHICNKVKWLGAHKDKVHLVHNGIRVKDFNVKKSYESEGEVTFCFIGRFVEKKSPVLLLKSFQCCLDMIENIRCKLIMVGDGRLMSDSQKFVRDNHLEEFVDFEGYIPHAQIPEYLVKTDIYVQHSVTAPNGDQEGMGVTLAEASASGIPVITTNHNGFPDVVKDGDTGLLVEEGDFERMGNEMARLAKDEKLRKILGKNARQHMESEFDMKKQIVKNINVLKGVIN
ncbi:glycosyltransferase family 4 protein [Fodinibius sp. AD559]|uniref:glycosyltransferase family 4 protein n=1 Tax=Fodinibius sp. AD559 TaxID=3424179 RepID=UPI004046A87F